MHYPSRYSRRFSNVYQHRQDFQPTSYLLHAESHCSKHDHRLILFLVSSEFCKSKYYDCEGGARVHVAKEFKYYGRNTSTMKKRDRQRMLDKGTAHAG
jgi:hypothetical protein